MTPTYLFTSSRLGFRLWRDSDLTKFSAMNADEETMFYFEKPLSEEESKAMMERMNKLYTDRGFCYFAVEFIETGEFIGMIGMGWKTFEADFTPCVDIGWRLERRFWNQGFASEGAIRVLAYAQEKGIKEVYSYASNSNKASIKVMEKAGLSYLKDFDHEDLKNIPRLNPCSLYKMTF
jgi:RimJ/RimL family protein N-acetyltransferase